MTWPYFLEIVHRFRLLFSFSFLGGFFNANFIQVIE